MSKLVISADSETKDTVVTLDGKVIDGIRDGWFGFGFTHHGEKHLSLDITRVVVDQATKLSKNERLTWTPAGLKDNLREAMKAI